jgi:hypothetical protein
MQMFNIIKAAFPNCKFESLAPIAIKNACDYIIAAPVSTKSLVAVVEKVNPPPAIIASAPKSLMVVGAKKKEVYDFIEENESGPGPVPEAGTVSKRLSGPVPEAKAPVKILKRPAPEAGGAAKHSPRPVPEKTLASPTNEIKLQRVGEGQSPTNEIKPQRDIDDPTNPLQLLLALNDPDMMLMDAGQWGSYIHKYVTDEYVYIGQTKSMPFYRKRKQLMTDLEALERSKGSKLMEYENILNYLAWRYDMQLLVHKYDSEKKTKSIEAYPEMHLWRRSTPIYCVGSAFVSPLKFSQLRDYIETSEDTGVLIKWPEADGKKTELLAELGGEGSHLKKDELSILVGKKRVYDLLSK